MTDVPADKDFRSGRRQFVWGGALLLAAGTAAAMTPRRTIKGLAHGTLERVIPKEIGPYRFQTVSGLVTPPEDEISQRIYDEVLTRVYAAPNLPAVMLLIAYGSAQDAGLALHRPEFCYPAQGYTLSNAEIVPVSALRSQAVSATFLSAARQGQAEQILYWNRIGKRFPTSVSDEKSAVFRANLQGMLPDGVLVRMSMATDSKEAALGPLQDFNTLMLSSLGSTARQILLGSAPS